MLLGKMVEHGSDRRAVRQPATEGNRRLHRRPLRLIPQRACDRPICPFVKIQLRSPVDAHRRPVRRGSVPPMLPTDR